MDHLKQIREALILAEKLRLDSKDISQDQREKLELASIELRNQEREIIISMQDNVVKAVKESVKDLENVIKLMRKRALRMSRSAKSVNKIKEAINTISEIASQIQKI